MKEKSFDLKPTEVNAENFSTELSLDNELIKVNCSFFLTPKRYLELMGVLISPLIKEDEK